MPVYTSNEDYEKKGKAPPDERKAYMRIYHEALKKKMSAGSVCVYIVAPDGPVMDSKTVPDTKKVFSMLEGAIEKLRLKEGPTLVAPRPQSAPPKAKAEAGDLVLHLSAPYEQRSGSWHEVPAETWIVLNKAEWSAFLPPENAQPGASWLVGAGVTAKLYSFFYPATEDTLGNQIDRNKIETQELKATLESVSGGVARARLEGRLKMRRPFYPNHPEQAPGVVEAEIAGFMEFEPGKDIRWLKLATVSATYAKWKFGVALRSLPKPLFDFEAENDLECWSNLEVSGQKEPPVKRELSAEHATSGTRSLKLTFGGGRWPAIATARVPEDWNAFQTFKADVSVSRTCVVGFRVIQEKSTRKDGWDDCVGRWEKTAILQPGTNEVSAPLHPNDWSAILPKHGKVTALEIYMYAPHEGETIFVDNIRCLSDKSESVNPFQPQAAVRFKVLGTEWEVAGVKELAEKLKAQWIKAEEKTIEQVEADLKAQFEALKKAHPGAVLAVFRDGESGFDSAAPEKIYAGWKDAYWTSHGPDSNTRYRAENLGKSEQVEIFMRHRSPLMRADLSAIPAGSNILAARLVLVRASKYDEKDHHPGQPNMWVAEACNRPWEENDVNAYEYARGRFWKQVGGAYYGADPDFLPLYLAHGPSQGMVNTWDFTEAVKFWTSGANENHGFMLHGDSKDWLGRAHCRESKDVHKRPALLVIYEPKPAN